MESLENPSNCGELLESCSSSFADAQCTYEDRSTNEDPASSPDLEWLEELSDSELGDDNPVAADDTSNMKLSAETARMFKLRRNLDQLDHFHRQKEHEVLKAREELKLCRQHIEELLEQREELEKETERQKAAENSAAVFRLRAQHRRLCQELLSEEELEALIKTELRKQELQLCEVEVELGRFSSLRQEVLEEEQRFQVHKAQKAAKRLQEGRRVSQNRQLKLQHPRTKQTSSLKNTEAGDQKVNNKKTAKLIKENIVRMQRQEAEREQQNRELLEKRRQAVRSLQSNIAATQESIRMQQTRAKANAQKKAHKERQLRESLQAQGINSIKHVYQHKQQEETTLKQQELEERQKSKRLEIVSKILQEEQQMKKKKRQQSRSKPVTSDKVPNWAKAREMLLHYLEPIPPSPPPQTKTLYRELSDSSSEQSATSDPEDLDETREMSQAHGLTDSLDEPEFCGLWGQNYKEVNKKLTLVQTEAEQDKYVATSEKFNISAKKVLKKHTKGAPFISKPEMILFKDFEVGKVYKKKIILTNTSYSSNYCKYIGVSASLKDFMTISFEPPGLLSTGMSCDLQAVFQPMMNEDLEGEMQFASATGAFSVPVKCTTKKCQLVVDSQFIDFGSHVVGQTISRSVTLTNQGALATLFSLDMSDSLTPESSHVQLPSRDSASTCQEVSIDSKPCEDKKSCESSLEAPEAQLKMETEEEAGAEAELCQTSNMETWLDQDTSDSICHIHFGSVTEGEIGPFQSIRLEIVFKPTIPGETKTIFYIKFSDKNSQPISIRVRAAAISLPVWVAQPNIDMKICMLDHLYHHSVSIHSRANTALKLTFEVCSELRNHMDIVPKIGFVQAKSSFKAQLKFLPRQSLPEDAKSFFDKDTGVLEVPMAVQVAGQLQPASFTVQAVVTCSELQFDRTEVNFGYCCVSQPVRSSVQLTNLSLLPQDFGFFNIPEFIEVQPNDGFGTLLPQETLHIHLIFSAKKAQDYSFQLSCKSGTNRDFFLSCRAVGVHPPLELSRCLVQFGATAIGDTSSAILYVTNHSTERYQSKQAPSLVPALPRLFCFSIPDHSDISISPSTGCLLPGERCLVQVTFRPSLWEQELRETVLRLQQDTLQQEQDRKRLTEQEAKKDAPAEPSKGKKASEMTDITSEENKAPTPEPPDALQQSEQYDAACALLLYSFSQRYQEHTVPCFVSDGKPLDECGQPSWSPINTLYLKLQCPAVQPPLVVISNSGRNIINFNQVIVGERVVQKCVVQNISKDLVDLRSSILDIDGPFSVLNALRPLRPGQKHTLLLAFSPALGKKYQERLEVQSQRMSLKLTLRGEGVIPEVTCSHVSPVLDYGYVLAKESTTQVLKLQNHSAVEVGFRMLLSSQSLSRPHGGTDILELLQRRATHSRVQPAVGTENYSGLSVFSVVPAEGSIAPGQSRDISVMFQPDHPSEHYCDQLTVELRNKSKVCEMNLKGSASSYNMYVSGGDPLTLPTESLLPPVRARTAEEENLSQEKCPIPVLVTLRASYSAGVLTPAVREVQVGCIRSTQPAKKIAEFCWENVTSLQQQGFTVEPSRGSVEAGSTRTITITWTPPSKYKPYEVVQSCVPLTLKGDDVNIYRVTLMALVSTSAH